MSFVTFDKLGHYGELGNQMFQIATTIGYAKKHGKSPIFPKWTCKISNKDYSRIFPNVDQSFHSGVEANINWFELKYSDLPATDKNVNLTGYFQSERYFDHCKEDVKQAFTPNSDVIKLIEERNAIILNTDNRVCLHVRTAKRSSNDYDVHSSATLEFITNAMSHFEEDVTYVVFVDNMEEAKKILPLGKNYILIDGQENYEDLILMTYFDKYIVSPSTFGWWGAWLSKSTDPKIVIKRDWFAIGKAKEYLNDNDIVPSHWIKTE